MGLGKRRDDYEETIYVGPAVEDHNTRLDVAEGYEPLAAVLQAALDQAQHGKGARCHANGLPFLEQPIMCEARNCGLGAMAYQVRKKTLEALNCPDDERATEDMLGAINYAAAMVIHRREQAVAGLARPANRPVVDEVKHG